MKKVLLSLAMVLAGVGAWAQDVSYVYNAVAATELKEGKYVIWGRNSNNTNGGYVNGNRQIINTTFQDGMLVDPAYIWTLTKNDTTFTLQNSSTSNYFVAEGTRGKAWNNMTGTEIANLVATQTEIGGTIYYVINQTNYTFKNETNGQKAYIHTNANNLSWYSGGDLTSFTNSTVKFQFYALDAVTPENITYTLTDNAGNSYNGTYQGVAEETLPSFPGATISNPVWNGTELAANITFPFLVSKSGGTTNSFSISNWGTNVAVPKRWHAVLEEGVYNVKVQTQVPLLSDLYSWMWAIYPEFNDGAFTFKIMNVATNKYVYANPEKGANATGEKGFFTLQDEGTPFGITMNGTSVHLSYVNGAGTTLKLTTNGSADSDVYLGAYAGTHDGNIINTPSFATLIVNVEHGYATLFSPFNVQLPEGLNAYAVSEISANSAKLTAIEGGKIPAEYGVILESNNDSDTLTVLAEESIENPANLLAGTLVTQNVEGPAYVLANGSNGVGFYLANLGDAGEFQNNAFKAYLSAEGGASARTLLFDFGTETAIESIEGAENADAVVYDLAGRRVKGAQKGLYIVNGKVVIK